MSKSKDGARVAEIVLYVNNENVKEFEMDCVPRKGERLTLDLQELKGVCTVVDVVHVIFSEKRTDIVRNYVKLYATT